MKSPATPDEIEQIVTQLTPAEYPPVSVADLRKLIAAEGERNEDPMLARLADGLTAPDNTVEDFRSLFRSAMSIATGHGLLMKKPEIAKPTPMPIARITTVKKEATPPKRLLALFTETLKLLILRLPIEADPSGTKITIKDEKGLCSKIFQLTAELDFISSEIHPQFGGARTFCIRDERMNEILRNFFQNDPRLPFYPGAFIRVPSQGKFEIWSKEYAEAFFREEDRARTARSAPSVSPPKPVKALVHVAGAPARAANEPMEGATPPMSIMESALSRIGKI